MFDYAVEHDDEAIRVYVIGRFRWLLPVRLKRQIRRHCREGYALTESFVGRNGELFDRGVVSTVGADERSWWVRGAVMRRGT